jgi:hypothetical protein
MPDGQLQSHLVRAYISPDIPSRQNPKLHLFTSHALTGKDSKQDEPIAPILNAANQQWTELIGTQQVTHTGTLMLFDLGGLNFRLKPMVRVMPVVSWTEAGEEKIAVSSKEVNIGNIVAIIGWTSAVIVTALLFILALSGLRSGGPLLLLAGVDGHLSLAQTQVAFWTVIIGGVVLGYGLVKLDIPDIPGSVLALMGASLATGGIGFFQDSQNQQAAAPKGGPFPRRILGLGDLLRVFPPDGGPPELSLAKAQMIFWTVLLMLLFVSKSILDGTIWEIPWGLVALMGFSQAGYLTPKFGPQSATAQTSTPAAPAAQKVQSANAP